MSSNKPPEPNKTLVGIPGDFQAAVDKLRAQQGTGNAEDMHRTRLGNPQLSGAHAAPPPLPSNRPFQPPAGFQPAPPPPPLQNMPAHARVPPAERTLLGMPNNLQAIIREAEANAAQRAAEQAIARASEAVARRATDAVAVQRAAVVREPVTQPHGTGAPAAQASRVHLHLDGADSDAPQDGPDLYSTRLAPSELESAGEGRRREDSDTDVVRRPRLALSDRTTQRTAQSDRKLWPMIAAAVAGVVVLGGGGWLAAHLVHSGSARDQPDAVALPPLADKAHPTLPSSTVTDVSAATQPERVPRAEPAAAPPTQAAPVTLASSPAELERQAIDLLIAKNYPAAAQAYERLRQAEPENKAYAVMLGLLSRGEGKSCGQPGQEPCASR